MDSGVAQLLAVGGLVAVAYLVMSSRQPTKDAAAPSRQTETQTAVESYATPPTARERQRTRRRERAGMALDVVAVAAQLGSALVDRR